MFTRIPPVRRRVPATIRPAADDMRSLEKLAQGYQLTFYRSGTEALSTALSLARQDRDIKRPPEVILPAYGCPDLIAASEYAGLRVRLVDVCSEVWGYDAVKLRSAFSANTAAVVGVNLLGSGDQQDLLRDLSEAHRCRLIQDSAQYLPDLAAPRWCGDAVILSFGRGKPLNLLHGGALLSRCDTVSISAEPNPEPTRSRLLSSSAAALAFNLATHRFVYRFASRLPILKIGGTRYTPLRGCHQLSPKFRARVANALSHYQVMANYSAMRWQASLAEWEAMGIRVLSGNGDLKPDTQYLRLPLLAPSSAVRDAILARLTAAGLGASAMYRLPLNRITGVPEAVRRQGPFPGAEALAARLFTLPTHDDVNAAIVDRTCREIRCVMRMSRSA